MSKQAFKRVRRALGMEVNRKPLDTFAWPGGYPLFYLFTDGGCICPECANANIEEIDAAMRDPRGNRAHSSGCGGWAIDGFDVNYEEELSCDNCGEAIPAAYVTEEEFAARSAVDCSCPQVWAGHGEPRPDPKRVDADCPVHGACHAE